MTRLDQRPTDAQRQSTRVELHGILDRAIDMWPDAIRMANDMGRGYPTGADNTRVAFTTSRVESLAIAALSGVIIDDPALWAQEWLAELAEVRGALLRLERRRLRLLPDPAEPGRVNTVDLCAECGDPAPKVKRLDGEPYHPGNCWMRAYRRIRPDIA